LASMRYYHSPKVSKKHGKLMIHNFNDQIEVRDE
jgi:hypothetical protein